MLSQLFTPLKPKLIVFTWKLTKVGILASGLNRDYAVREAASCGKTIKSIHKWHLKITINNDGMENSEGSIKPAQTRQSVLYNRPLIPRHGPFSWYQLRAYWKERERGYTQIGPVLCNKGPIQTPALPLCLSALIKRSVSHGTAGTPHVCVGYRSLAPHIISLGGTTLCIMKWEAELMNRKLLWIIMFKEGGPL